VLALPVLDTPVFTHGATLFRKIDLRKTNCMFA